MSIIDGQARDLMVIVPSDTVLCAPSPIALYNGGAGNVVVITEAEWVRKRRLETEAIATTMVACTKITITAPPIGFILNVRVVAVYATGTTVGAGLLIGYLP